MVFPSELLLEEITAPKTAPSCHCCGCRQVAAVACSLQGRCRLVCKHSPLTLPSKPKAETVRLRSNCCNQHISKVAAYFEGQQFSISTFFHSFLTVSQLLGEDMASVSGQVVFRVSSRRQQHLFLQPLASKTIVMFLMQQ